MTLGRTILLVAIVAAVTFALAQDKPLLKPEVPDAATLEQRVQTLEHDVLLLSGRINELERKLKPRLELLK